MRADYIVSVVLTRCCGQLCSLRFAFTASDSWNFEHDSLKRFNFQRVVSFPAKTGLRISTTKQWFWIGVQPFFESVFEPGCLIDFGPFWIDVGSNSGLVNRS